MLRFTDSRRDLRFANRARPDHRAQQSRPVVLSIRCGRNFPPQVLASSTKKQFHLRNHKYFLRFATTLLILRQSYEQWSKPWQGGFHELGGVVRLRGRGGRRGDTDWSSHALDGAQEAEIRGLAERGYRKVDLRSIYGAFPLKRSNMR